MRDLLVSLLLIITMVLIYQTAFEEHGEGLHAMKERGIQHSRSISQVMP